MNWRHQLSSDFRDSLRNSGKDYESISNMCNKLILVLEKFKSFDKVNNYRLYEAIGENVVHFSFCKDFANGTIPIYEWEDYDFDGDLVGMFNSYLNEFYDICDTQIGNDTKFCFVGL